MSTVLNQILTRCFTDLEKIIFNFILKHKELRITKTVLGNRTISGGNIPNFKFYGEGYSNKNWMLLTNKDTQINETELKSQI